MIFPILKLVRYILRAFENHKYYFLSFLPYKSDISEDRDQYSLEGFKYCFHSSLENGNSIAFEFSWHKKSNSEFQGW